MKTINHLKLVVLAFGILTTSPSLFSIPQYTQAENQEFAQWLAACIMPDPNLKPLSLDEIKAFGALLLNRLHHQSLQSMCEHHNTHDYFKQLDNLEHELSNQDSHRLPFVMSTRVIVTGGESVLQRRLMRKDIREPHYINIFIACLVYDYKDILNSILYIVDHDYAPATSLTFDRLLATLNAHTPGWDTSFPALMLKHFDMIQKLSLRVPTVHPTQSTIAAALLHQTITDYIDCKDQDHRANAYVEWLVTHGVSVDAPNTEGNTPLHRAAGAGLTDMLDLLIQYNANPNALDAERNTPLHLGAYAVSPDTVRHLLSRGADPKAINQFGDTPLHATLLFHDSPFNRNLDETKIICQLLLDAGADVSARNNNGLTPLHMAAKLNALDCVQLLLDHGATQDVNKPDSHGSTPLHFATNPQIIALLLSHAAQVNSQDQLQDTPLHRCASGWRTLDSVKLLLEHGADPTIPNKLGQTPLQSTIWFALYWDGDIVDMANIDPAERSIVYNDIYARIMVLLEHGAGINELSRIARYRHEQMTPLHWAVEQPNAKLTAFLLDNGADPDIRNSEDQTVLDLALRHPNLKIISLLLGYKIARWWHMKQSHTITRSETASSDTGERDILEIHALTTARPNEIVSALPLTLTQRM